MTARPADPPELAITFLYYKDIRRALAFYRDIMGFPLAIDQGELAKIVQLANGACLGLVDEAQGMNSWQPEKCVQICVRVGDVPAWHSYLRDQGVNALSEMFVNDAIGIRAFVFRDPEGYQVEMQQVTRPGV